MPEHGHDTDDLAGFRRLDPTLPDPAVVDAARAAADAVDVEELLGEAWALLSAVGPTAGPPQWADRVVRWRARYHARVTASRAEAAMVQGFRDVCRDPGAC